MPWPVRPPPKSSKLPSGRQASTLARRACLAGDAEPGIRRLTPEVVTTNELSLVYRREARVSPAVRAVARFVVDTVKKNDALILGARRTGT
jgi:hypothetical protein